MLNPMCPLPTSHSPYHPPFFKQLVLPVGWFGFGEMQTGKEEGRGLGTYSLVSGTVLTWHGRGHA